MKRLPIMLVRCLPLAALCALLGACNGYISLGSPIGSVFSIGGTLSGLPGGQSIVLLNNGRDSLTLAANGPFVFGGLVPFDDSYLVTISTQPASANCVVTNASGTISGLTVDLRNMGLEGSKVEGAGIPTGATVSSVTATTIVLSANATASTVGAQIRLFPNGNGDGATTFNLPDDRGRSSIGRDNMGGTAASRVTASGYGNPGVDATKLGAAGGVDRLALVAGQIPVLTGTTGNAGAHAHGYLDGGTSSAQRGALEPSYTMTSVPGDAVRTTDPVGDHAHSVTVNGDGGQAHPNLPPSRVSNKIIFTGVV